MPLTFPTDLFAYLLELMTTHASTFETIGNRLYASFTVILVAWFGIETALKGEGFPMDRFARMILTISFGFAMSTYYSVPVPGFGVSFYHLIVDQGTDLANQLNQRMTSTVLARLDALYMGIESPSLLGSVFDLEGVRWALTVLAIFFAAAAVLFVISFGYIATAVCVLLGPLFIPFFILPKMEWMFWGWLRSLLQYAFYPVVANAYVFVFGNMLINFVDRAGTNWSSAMLAVMFFPLLFLLIAFTWGMSKIPSLVNSLFTGKAGESALPV